MPRRPIAALAARVGRLRLALAAVIVAALVPAPGILLQVASAPATPDTAIDPMTRFERRLAPLRAALRGERSVGYLAPPQAVDRTAHLYSLRYTLAPVQVVDDADQPLVVADGVVAGERLPAALRVRRDFGDDLLLLERTR